MLDCRNIATMSVGVGIHQVPDPRDRLSHPCKERGAQVADTRLWLVALEVGPKAGASSRLLHRGCHGSGRSAQVGILARMKWIA